MQRVGGQSPPDATAVTLTFQTVFTDYAGGIDPVNFGGTGGLSQFAPTRPCFIRRHLTWGLYYRHIA
jgi:hypothetical protein